MKPFMDSIFLVAIGETSTNLSVFHLITGSASHFLPTGKIFPVAECAESGPLEARGIRLRRKPGGQCHFALGGFGVMITKHRNRENKGKNE